MTTFTLTAATSGGVAASTVVKRWPLAAQACDSTAVVAGIIDDEIGRLQHGQPLKALRSIHQPTCVTTAVPFGMLTCPSADATPALVL